MTSTTEKQSPLSQAWSDFQQARTDLERDLPGFVVVIDKHESLVRMRLDLMERRLLFRDNDREIAIKAGIAAGASVLLFPPFHWGGYRGGQSIGLGHSFILSSPVIEPSQPKAYGSIDSFGLMAILAGIAAITWAATLVRWRSQ